MIATILKGGPGDGAARPGVPAGCSISHVASGGPEGRYLATGQPDDLGRRVFGFSPPRHP